MAPASVLREELRGIKEAPANSYWVAKKDFFRLYVETPPVHYRKLAGAAQSSHLCSCFHCWDPTCKLVGLWAVVSPLKAEEDEPFPPFPPFVCGSGAHHVLLSLSFLKVPRKNLHLIHFSGLRTFDVSQSPLLPLRFFQLVVMWPCAYLLLAFWW